MCVSHNDSDSGVTESELEALADLARSFEQTRQIALGREFHLDDLITFPANRRYSSRKRLFP